MTRRAAAAALGLAFGPWLGAAPPARAQAPAQPPAARAERDELARVRAERAEVEARLRGLQATARDLRSEVSTLDRQADATARLVSTLDRQLSLIVLEEQEVGARLAGAESELARQQGGLQRRLVAIYKRGPLYEAEALLSAASFGDLVARYKYLHELARRDRALVRRVEALRDEVAGQREAVGRLRTELARSRDERAAEESRLRTFGSRGAAALAAVERQREGARRRLAELERDEARVAGLLANFETARRRADARAAAPGAAPAAPMARLAVGTLEWPVRGTMIYRFGRVAGANNTSTRWNGIGIAAAAGTPVRAAASGQVVLVQPIGTYGLTVIVQHAGGDYSVYGSLQRADVRVGDPAVRGQVVGAVGATDPDLPAHLHFEVRPGGRAVDPLTLLR